MKSRYLYFKSNSGDGHYKVLVKSRDGKTARYDMGSLEDPESRIGMIWNAINNLTKDPFTKSEIERIAPQACCNNRQPLKAGFDLLAKLGYVVPVDVGARHPKYRRSGTKPKIISLDSILSKGEPEKKEPQS